MKLTLTAAIKWAACFALAQWQAVPAESRNMLVALVGLMALDYFTGLGAAFVTKTVSSDTGIKGLLKKAMMLSVLLAAHFLEKSVGIELHLETAGAIGFVVNEGISITENCNRAGVWIPPTILNALAKLKGDEK